eukprot:s1665_g20.t1
MKISNGMTEIPGHSCRFICLSFSSSCQQSSERELTCPILGHLCCSSLRRWYVTGRPTTGCAWPALAACAGCYADARAARAGHGVGLLPEPCWTTTCATPSRASGSTARSVAGMLQQKAACSTEFEQASTSSPREEARGWRWRCMTFGWGAEKANVVSCVALQFALFELVAICAPHGSLPPCPLNSRPAHRGKADPGRQLWSDSVEN